MSNLSQLTEKGWFPITDAERKAVRDQLDAILNSVYFRSSKRYPQFLRFVVEEKLSGRDGELKERTIGIEVFERDIVYNTAEDPIVRVTAAEVRKRLGSYYSEPSNSCQLRIGLSSGSYVPNFEKFCDSPASKLEPPIEGLSPADLRLGLKEADQSEGLPSPKVLTNHSSRWHWTACAAIVLAVSAVWFFHHRFVARQLSSSTSDALNAFWYPMINSQGIILASMGTLPQEDHSSAFFADQPDPKTNLLDAEHLYNIVPFADALALAKVSSFLGERQVNLRVLNSDLTSFDDVQNSPTILIGAFTNLWTLRLTKKLRFTFEDSPTISRIVDQQGKTHPDWILLRDSPYSSLTQDYAVIARYHDSTTGSITIIGAGIGSNGTVAAWNFMTNDEDLHQLLREVPRKDWDRVNLEAVIRTQVINGKSGPPQLVAATFW